MTTKRSGKLKYTELGFKQDAEDAIRGDVIRALIELITNADDAYDAKGGEIIIRVRKISGEFAHVISISDKAGGLPGDQMETAFTDLGKLNSKFVADKGTRGLFGRGAKDVAILGKAEFESISNGKLSTLTIYANSDYSMENVDETPTIEDYNRLYLSSSQNGLTSRLYLSPIYKIPNPGDLIRKLQNHVQLRELLNRNQVNFIDERNKSTLVLKGLQPSGKLIIDKELEIKNYSKKIKLRIYKFLEKVPGSIDEYTAHGLVISGRGASYENSFLHFNSRPETGWFCGTLDAPEIHDLAKNYDQEEIKSDLNPIRLVSRQRTGLINNHPYWRALCAAIEPELKPLFDEIAEMEGSSRKEGTELRNRFKLIAESMAKTLQNLMTDEELGNIPTYPGKDNKNVELSIIPPARIMSINETVTFTIRAPNDFPYESLKVSLEGKTDLIELGVLEHSKWRQHKRILATDNNLTLKALETGEITLVVSNSMARATCKISVINSTISIIDIPTTIVFEQKKYSISPEKVKKMLVKAPLQMSGEELKVECDPKLAELKDVLIFEPNSSGIYAEANIFAKAGNVFGKTKIKAYIENETAFTELEIRELAQSKIPNLRMELNGRDNPPNRVDTLLETGTLVVRIYGKHKSLKEVLGAYSQKGFKYENTPQARASIAEIVAQQLAQYVVERESEMYPDRFGDAAKYFFRQQQLIADLIIVAQVGLIQE